MNRKCDNPFKFLYSRDSDTESASEGEITSSNNQGKKRKLKRVQSSCPEPDVQILKVELGPTRRQIEIVKVDRPVQKNCDVEIVKVVPGTSEDSSPKQREMKLPIQCRKIEVKGYVGKPWNRGKIFLLILVNKIEITALYFPS